MLAELNLKPEPVIIEVEHRRASLCPHLVSLLYSPRRIADEEVLRPLLSRLTKSTDIPILLVGGNTLGTMEEMRYLYKKGELARKMNGAGAIVNGGKKKKGRRH